MNEEDVYVVGWLSAESATLLLARLKRLVTLAHRGDTEVRDEFKRGTISLWYAYARTVGADGNAAEAEPVVRYVEQRFAIMARMMDAWAACPPEARGRLTMPPG